MRIVVSRIPFSRLLALSVVFLLFIILPPYRVSTLKTPGPANALRVLFVGNSLTYSNDLPSVVAALAKATGQKTLAYKTIAFPDFSLEDHWNKKDARRAIARGGWDCVVLQQGPSASREGRALLLEYTRRFAEEIRRVDARPALYMVWPARSRVQDFKGVSESYRQAAEDVDGLVFPVGEAWLGAWKMNPGLELYSGDGLHPSQTGSYLAALVIYQQLYNRSPMGLPSKLQSGSGVKLEVPSEQAELMQQAAEDANQKFRRP
jgi:hypothetical protein